MSGLPAPVIELSLLLGQLRADRAFSADMRLRARGVIVRAVAAFRGERVVAGRIDARTAKAAFDAVWDELSAAGADPADMTGWAMDAAERNNRPRGRQ